MDEYLRDLNATQAAIRSGYSPRGAGQTGERLLRNADIAEAVERGMQERSERTQITQDDVVKGLYDEATRQGKDASHSARVQAWAHLGRHLGMFTDRLTVDHSLEQPHQIAQRLRVRLPEREGAANGQAGGTSDN